MMFMFRNRKELECLQLHQMKRKKKKMRRKKRRKLVKNSLLKLKLKRMNKVIYLVNLIFRNNRLEEKIRTVKVIKERTKEERTGRT